ncbi:MAG: ABC transporter permease [Ardenticatenales bacterium]|nr:ABC transporter permease [Ardenticatenales bacterium]MCB9172365.1 ABC transporter permease [Ardenticatenales bacterium]
MGNLSRLFVRASSFFSKEIFEILRQPRLIATLVLGPFLILLLFGIGYRNEAPVLRTVFVVPAGSPLETEIEKYASDLGEQLDYRGATTDLEGALAQLKRGEIDLVAVAPFDAYSTIRYEGEQAVFTLYHNEIDPLQADYVRYFGKIYIDEVNRRILRAITERGQEQSISISQRAASARQNSAAMRDALARGDVVAARDYQRAFERDLYQLETDTNTTIELLDNVDATLGGDADNSTEAVRSGLQQIRDNQAQLGLAGDSNFDSDAQISTATQIEAELATLESSVADLEAIDSRVLVSPFRSETQSVAPATLLAQYFAPAVIVLLLQHLAVTFGALTMVRERQLGTVELFRVSPISPAEVLVGKYAGYLLFGGVVAAILTAVMVSGYQLPLSGLGSLIGTDTLTLGLGVPMGGNWLYFSAVVFALLFASVGLGFVISLIVDTDSQAVQYAMIVLLSSVFFSGVFLRLETLLSYVRAVSWSLPATYAVQLLQTIMLRGQAPSVRLLATLFGMGVLFYLVAWLLLGRQMRYQAD